MCTGSLDSRFSASIKLQCCKMFFLSRNIFLTYVSPYLCYSLKLLTQNVWCMKRKLLAHNVTQCVFLVRNLNWIENYSVTERYWLVINQQLYDTYVQSCCFICHWRQQIFIVIDLWTKIWTQGPQIQSKNAIYYTVVFRWMCCRFFHQIRWEYKQSFTFVHNVPGNPHKNWKTGLLVIGRFLSKGVGNMKSLEI